MPKKVSVQVLENGYLFVEYWTSESHYHTRGFDSWKTFNDWIMIKEEFAKKIEKVRSR